MDAAETGGNTALIDGVRKFAMDVRELDIDLIDRLNPFGEAYAILAKTMSEESLKLIAAIISAKRVNLTPEEARELAKRALTFKQERGRLLADVRFSNRPFEVKRFQTIHHCNVDVARGLVLLFGIGTRAFPSWDSRTRRNNLLVGLAVS